MTIYILLSSSFFFFRGSVPRLCLSVLNTQINSVSNEGSCFFSWGFRAFPVLLGLETDSRTWFVVFEIETLFLRGSCGSFGISLDDSAAQIQLQKLCPLVLWEMHRGISLDDSAAQIQLQKLWPLVLWEMHRGISLDDSAAKIQFQKLWPLVLWEMHREKVHPSFSPLESPRQSLEPPSPCFSVESDNISSALNAELNLGFHFERCFHDHDYGYYPCSKVNNGGSWEGLSQPITPSDSPSRIGFTSSWAGLPVQKHQEKSPVPQNDGPFSQQSMAVLRKPEQGTEDAYTTAYFSDDLSIFRKNETL
ncbi:hypothetical protein VNO80_16816 [Phaseolus coccineus]|uniref:Uncharacterized protein n=1 Tax=Phaseolus coccineus TaxID=3886 RepID=A0AAN9R340_PHACN